MYHGADEPYIASLVLVHGRESCHAFMAHVRVMRLCLWCACGVLVVQPTRFYEFFDARSLPNYLAEIMLGLPVVVHADARDLALGMVGTHVPFQLTRVGTTTSTAVTTAARPVTMATRTTDEGCPGRARSRSVV